MSSLHLVVGNKNFSSWSMRPWVALRQAGIPFRETVILLDTPTAREEKLAHSPAGKVPILHDGEVTVWDSLAICEYLAETHPEENLWPADPAARAQARSICAEMHAGFNDLRKDLPMNCRARKRTGELSAGTRADLDRIATMWTETRKSFGKGGAFLFGAPTIADAFYAPVASRMRTYGIEPGGEVTVYRDALLTSPAVQQWHTDAAAEKATLPYDDLYPDR